MNKNCQESLLKSLASKTLNKNEIEFLSYNSVGVKVKKGDMFIQQGALSSNIVYLKKGLAKIHIKGPYYEQLIKLVKAPRYIGLPNNFGDKINNYSVTAVEDSEVCYIDLISFNHLLSNNDKFAYEIIINLSNNEIDSFKRCASRTQKQIRGNIADVLIDFSERIYNSKDFKVPITRSEIANMIDSSRESVSRILNEFEHDEIIIITGKRIKIIDEQKLKLISEKG